jgi:hypothetical protein
MESDYTQRRTAKRFAKRGRKGTGWIPELFSDRVRVRSKENQTAMARPAAPMAVVPVRNMTRSPLFKNLPISDERKDDLARMHAAGDMTRRSSPGRFRP